MLIIKNANLITMAKDNYVKGSIVVEGKKILEVGKDIDLTKYKNAEVIDAQNKFVTPGLVDPHCHVGASEEGIQFEGNDTNERSGPIYPELQIVPYTFIVHIKS